MNDDDKPNILIRFWHFITFRTYGNQLLTTSSKSYLTGLFVIMTIVALVEAFAWGHFGTNLSPNDPLVGKLTVGLIAFGVLWFFDYLMVTQDLLANEHIYTLEGEEKPRSLLGLWKAGSYFVFVLRLLIVIASVYVTSDFITQLYFTGQSHYKNKQMLHKF